MTRSTTNASLALLLLGCFTVPTATATSQRMGHSNTNAPEITQIFRIADKSKMTLAYQSITWASGSWAKALNDPNMRSKMRERINSAATSDPLGSFECSTMVKIGSRSVPRGNYKLAFMLSEKFTWQIVLTGKKRVAIDLRFGKAAKERKRLTMNLVAGEANFTGSLQVVFGSKACELDVVPLLRKPEKIAGFVNTMCPLMDEAIDADISVMHGGKKIGMCCEDCVDDWKKLSKVKKDAHLQKLLGK